MGTRETVDLNLNTLHFLKSFFNFAFIFLIYLTHFFFDLSRIRFYCMTMFPCEAL